MLFNRLLTQRSYVSPFFFGAALTLERCCVSACCYQTEKHDTNFEVLVCTHISPSVLLSCI